MTVTLETPRLVLRKPAMGDWEAFRAFLESDRARHIGGPYSGRDTWRAFAGIAGQWLLLGFSNFIAVRKDTGKPIASVGPWFPPYHPEREIGWSVWDAEAEGKGYAFEAAIAARDFAFGSLGWETAVSYIDPKNSRSIALAERLGCTLDDTAPKPYEDEPSTLVYRHPAPDSDGNPEAYA